jgi:glycosyltransferase involved in cell wall biosynthesis
MRIASVITRLNIGGASPPVIALAAGFQARGHESVLVLGTPEPHEGTLEEDARKQGIRLERVPAMCRNPRPWNDARAAAALYLLFRRFRPDVVASHMSKAGALARVAARLARVPVIVHTYHGKGFHVFQDWWRERTVLTVERWLAALATGNIVVSDLQRAEFERLRIAPSRLRVIRYGLDLETLTPEGGATLKCELGLGDDVSLVGVVGRLVRIKGQREFLQAAASLADLSNVHYVLVGDGHARRELEETAATLGIANRVHFLGWRRDIPAVLRALDVVCLPTINDFEGTPLAVIEALAARRPVVASEVGGVAEVVRHGETGLLVPPRDPKALAAAIRLQLLRREDAHRMARAGEALVRRLYTRERMIAETEAYFAALLSERRPA